MWGKRKVAGGRKKQLAYSILDTHTVLGHKLELIFIRAPIGDVYGRTRGRDNCILMQNQKKSNENSNTRDC